MLEQDGVMRVSPDQALLCAEEEELVIAAQNGDVIAVEALVWRHRRALCVYLHRLSTSADFAEDLAQETLIAAWRSIDSCDPRRPFRPWLQGIARNQFRMAVRRRGQAPVASLDQLLAAEIEIVSQADVAERVLAADEVEEVLDTLFAHQASALLLNRWAGLTAREVANLHGITEPAAQRRIYRAAQVFRARFTAASEERDCGSVQQQEPDDG